MRLCGGCGDCLVCRFRELRGLTMGTPSRWAHFSKEELMCKCGCGKGEEMMDDEFMRTIVWIREEAGFAMPMSSGYRCPTHNNKVSKTGFDGPHTTGRAADFRLSRKQADIIDRLAVKSEVITGRGWKQHGALRFIHLDNLPDGPGRPRPVPWSYP